MILKHRRFLSRLAFSLAAATTLPLAAQAWDPAGHMLVDQIAWTQMKPAARERVSQLVRGLETTYNEAQIYNFVTAGCWMDDMRSKKGYEWSQWHYVNIPYTPSGSPCVIPAEGPHVVWAIEENLKTLRNSQATPAEATLALAMLEHFVGDVHQPLHATEWNDRGGNTVIIRGIPFSDLWPGTVANLHAFWDKAFRFDDGGGKIVERWRCALLSDRPKAPDEGVIAEEARKIMAAFPPETLPQLATGTTAEAWAGESHLIGCLAAYPTRTHPTDHEAITLAPDFAHQSGQIAQQRVALAGYRLAGLLNQLFP